MSIANVIIRTFEFFYIKPFERVVPREVFRYLCCGATNAVLDTVWYYIIYHYIVCEQFIDLGFVVVSPHIASLAIVFPITFLTGFWLNRNVAFRAISVKSTPQMVRYGISVIGSIALNYCLMKLFVEAMHIWATPSKMLTTLVCAVYSYLVGRYFTFRN